MLTASPRNGPLNPLTITINWIFAICFTYFEYWVFSFPTEKHIRRIWITMNARDGATRDIEFVPSLRNSKKLTNLRTLLRYTYETWVLKGRKSPPWRCWEKGESENTEKKVFLVFPMYSSKWVISLPSLQDIVTSLQKACASGSCFCLFFLRKDYLALCYHEIYSYSYA